MSGLTAAGAAPEFNRIPFLIHPLGKEENETIFQQQNYNFRQFLQAAIENYFESR